jgi:nucleotide-binding universal stress UspA family protein
MAELPHYRKILLATDGSEQAALAVRHAVAIARQTGATLTALYVVDMHLAFSLGIHQDEALHELRQEGELALAAVAELAGQTGVEVDSQLHDGRPGEVMIREAERLGADLIVMGSHGQGALEDILLGSVSQYVVHHADIPVLVVRPPRHATTRR